jgi:RNA polymerase sigma factor (sigma-70 family)
MKSGVRRNGDRRLSVAEATFYAAIYGSARKGCLAELRRRGCTEEEAEEIFTDALARVMGSVDPVARDFSEGQMVAYIKRACWSRLIDERRRRSRSEMELTSAWSLHDSTAPDPREIAEDREAVAIGREALQMLPERGRRIFRQRHQMCLTPAEIVKSTPGLSLRTYRKVIQRANAQALEAFERIQEGARCEELRAGLLASYAAGEATKSERSAVEAHLAHCQTCTQDQIRMRDYLIVVAGGVLFTAGAGHHGIRGAAAEKLSCLLELGSTATHRITALGGELRERARDAVLRFAPSLSGGDTAAGHVLNASSAQVASVCASVAAGVCVAAGVLSAAGINNHSGDPDKAAARTGRPSRSVIRPVHLPFLDESASKSGPEDVPGHGARRHPVVHASHRSPQALSPAARSLSPTFGAPNEARISGRQTGTEVGAESGGQPLSSNPAQTDAGSSLSQSTSASGIARRPAKDAAPPTAKPGPEFGM